MTLELTLIYFQSFGRKAPANETISRCIHWSQMKVFHNSKSVLQKKKKEVRKLGGPQRGMHKTIILDEPGNYRTVLMGTKYTEAEKFDFLLDWYKTNWSADRSNVDSLVHYNKQPMT